MENPSNFERLFHAVKGKLKQTSKTVISRQYGCLLVSAFLCVQLTQAQGRYTTTDFHQHTTYSDGSYSFGYMMEKNNEYGLDWWVNSEHGGGFNRWAWASV